MSQEIKAQLKEYSASLSASVDREFDHGFHGGVMTQIISDLAETIPEVKAYLEWLGAIKKEEETA